MTKQFLVIQNLIDSELSPIVEKIEKEKEEKHNFFNASGFFYSYNLTQRFRFALNDLLIEFEKLKRKSEKQSKLILRLKKKTAK